MTTVDHKAHVWARTPAGIRCRYVMGNARPLPCDIAKLAAEAQPVAGRTPRS